MKLSSRMWWIVLSILALLSICYVFSTLLTYLLIAIVVSFIGDPVVSALRRIEIKGRKMPRWLCAGIALFVFLGVFTGIIALFIPVVAREAKVIAAMDLDALTTNIKFRFDSFTEWLNNLGLNFTADDFYTTILNEMRGVVSVSQVTGAANNLFGFFGQLVAGFFSVLFISFFFLKDGSLFYKMVFTLTPERHIEKMKNILTHSHQMLSRYFGGLLIQMLIVTALVAISLSLLGVRNAMIIGVFAGLANIIPYLGPILSASFALLIGITTGLASDMDFAVSALAVKIALVFVGVQFLDNWVLQPLVLGSSVNVHPLELFIVFLAAATIGGVIGMILALPVYAIVRIVAREFFNQFKVVETLTRDVGRLDSE